MKNSNIALRRKIIRGIVVESAVSEEDVQKIITHQFEGVVKAMETHGINSVEISGFGKFIFLYKKALRRLQVMEEFIGNGEKMINGAKDARRKSSINRKVEYTKIMRSNIMNKVYGNKGDLRRMEEQADSSQEAEGDD